MWLAWVMTYEYRKLSEITKGIKKKMNKGSCTQVFITKILRTNWNTLNTFKNFFTVKICNTHILLNLRTYYFFYSNMKSDFSFNLRLQIWNSNLTMQSLPSDCPNSTQALRLYRELDIEVNYNYPMSRTEL